MPNLPEVITTFIVNVKGLVFLHAKKGLNCLHIKGFRISAASGEFNTYTVFENITDIIYIQNC